MSSALKECLKEESMKSEDEEEEEEKGWCLKEGGRGVLKVLEIKRSGESSLGAVE